MRRVASQPRPGWRRTVESQGLAYAVGRDAGTGAEVPYWDESAAYEFSEDEADELEAATEELHRMSLVAARRLLDDERLLASLGLPPHAAPMLRRSLEAGGPSLYGRFDLVYDGSAPPVLLEYNADTPTALVEAAVVQWFWLEDVHPGRDQVNTLHERLVRFWRGQLPAWSGTSVHFAAGQSEPTEDWVTLAYLRDTAREAGLHDEGLRVEDIGWWEEAGRFVDARDRPIDVCFKLYPWEWMLAERFGPLLDAPSAGITWIEPAWKALLSSKALLVALWEEFEGHPMLVPAALDEPDPGAGWARRGVVSKPVYGWEGAGVRVRAGALEETAPPGHTAGQRLVHQQYAELPVFDGNRALVGSWVVGGRAAGLGVRESANLITDTRARFVPHYLDAPRSTPEQVAAWLAG
ncbi:glutathionylspermidine synthase family protein [Kineococcus glutinatus]|uniref:Glutathionylspermidine synthase family protein n=1 Tax=Kineococcus glutinatus TaxID=1070872 RepID=A0ABP9H809_9ACTN